LLGILRAASDSGHPAWTVAPQIGIEARVNTYELRPLTGLSSRVAVHGATMAAGGELSLEELLAALGDSHAAAQGQAWDPDAWEWDGLLPGAAPRRAQSWSGHGAGPGVRQGCPLACPLSLGGAFRCGCQGHRGAGRHRYRLGPSAEGDPAQLEGIWRIHFLLHAIPAPPRDTGWSGPEGSPVAAEAGKRKDQQAARPARAVPNHMTGRCPASAPRLMPASL